MMRHDVVSQEDLDEEECPQGFKLSGSIPQAKQEAETPDGAAAGDSGWLVRIA